MQPMPRDQINPKVLRQFCFSMAIGFSVFFFLLIPWLFGVAHPIWPLIVAGLFLIPALVNPVWIYPVYCGWVPFARLMGWINSHILLGSVFYGLMFPIGRLMKWRQKLGYQDKLAPEQDSYYINHSKPFNRKDMENPF